MAVLPPPPDYACAPVTEGDLPHPPVTLEQAGFAEATAFAAAVARWLDGAREARIMSGEHVRFERAYLSGSQLRLYEWYGATFWLVRDSGGELVALHVAKPGRSPRKNAWGRYVNHYLAFTHPGRRRRGYATAAEAALQAQWAADGYDRLKTLCQSWLGFCYHEHLRDRPWGLNGNGELIVDSPLNPTAAFPAGVPIKARNGAWHEDGELTAGDLMQVMTDPAGRFRRDPAEVAAVLAKRAWRRPDSTDVGGPQVAMQRGHLGGPVDLSGGPGGANPPPSAKATR